MEGISNFLSSTLSHASESPTILHTIAALFIAYVGGILSSLTPCIYPMIPITVSVIGGGPSKAWKGVALRSLAYVSGMSIIYAFLGVVAGLTGQIFGSFTNHPNWYLGLGIVISFAALIMLDVIPFDPASWYQSWKRRRGEPVSIKEVSKQTTYLGAFALGATSGFIAAPCTTPILAAILGYIAKTQSVGLGFGLMLFFSWGLGTILILIAFFTGALQMLPRSGQWMNKIKIASGILLLAFAQYLIYQAGKMGGPS